MKKINGFISPNVLNNTKMNTKSRNLPNRRSFTNRTFLKKSLSTRGRHWQSNSNDTFL